MYKQPIVETEDVRLKLSVLMGSTVVDNNGTNGGSSANPVTVD